MRLVDNRLEGFFLFVCFHKFNFYASSVEPSLAWILQSLCCPLA